MRCAKNIIILSRSESRIWGAGDSEADRLGRKVREKAQEYLQQTKRRKVEVYASKEAGGWVATVVHAPESEPS